MEKLLKLLLAFTICLLCHFASAQAQHYDYFQANRLMIRNGVQAVLTCNGLFTSNRSIEQVFAQELAYLSYPLGDFEGGHYTISRKIKAVSVGGGEDGVIITAVFRRGIGCVVMAPDQGLSDIASLPVSEHTALVANTAQVLWPIGDKLPDIPLPDNVKRKSLKAASDWAFTRNTPEQDTLSLLIVHKGQIIHERYASGIDKNTRTRIWSTAKSIAVTLIGMLVDKGLMDLDAPLGIEWLPQQADIEADVRAKITLRHVLNMSSGLYPVDSYKMEYATGSGLSYWVGASSVDGARARALTREPGAVWDYENYDTLLAVYAMKLALGSDKDYQIFPYKALLQPLGMNSTLLGTDRFGDYVMSSQVYSNARDLARFGLLYQQNGIWRGERLLSEEWINFVRTPAPASERHHRFYGAQWWLVPDNRRDIPKDAYSTSGNRGQFVIVVPSHDLVIVRRGLDYGKQGFDRWDLTREVLKAFSPSDNSE
jgi:CubicO group peptidase (beta-lactamase class C family)